MACCSQVFEGPRDEGACWGMMTTYFSKALLLLLTCAQGSNPQAVPTPGEPHLAGQHIWMCRAMSPERCPEDGKHWQVWVLGDG